MTTNYPAECSRDALVIRSLFLLSIFLYPFQAVAHILYLLPQMGFLSVMLWRFMTTKEEVPVTWGLLCASAFFSVVSAIAVEVLAINPSYDLVLKMLVNVSTVCVVASRPSIFFGMESVYALRSIALSWLIISIMVYYLNGVDLGYIFISLTSGDKLDSSDLYGFAEPLANVYLSKNITAMFVASTFALFLYVSASIGKKVTLIDVSIFFFSVLVFLSRQALMAFLVLFVIYKLLNVSKKKALIIVGAGIGILYAFFMFFFNFNNSGDGASERLLLWRYFFEHFDQFYFVGFGLSDLNATLYKTIGIDNFHMFFMNQIGAYGLVHFIVFSVFCLLTIFAGSSSRQRWILVAAYYLNVLFQTYGYEYGNLFLLMAVYSVIRPLPDTKSPSTARQLV